MAIRIPILTSFDPKGLKQANASFAKLQGSIGSLGRNFAVAGAAIAAAGAVIAKNAQSLARIEQINAQTAQTIKSMGDVAGISATQVEALAGSLEKLTATEAESIQEGANLLLTFGNIRDNLGAGNDIFTQTTKIMVDLGVALKRGPVQTATMLGKALNDPIKGLTALTRVGVSFSDQQKEQVKALQQSGDLMGAQKVILAELQKQYGGSGAAYAKTFNGQLALMGHELGTIGEEATMAVMPALQGMVEQLREVLPLIGPQLKAAIESVDWKGLVKAVVDFTRFLIENATTIANVVIGIFILNTAFKAMMVATAAAQLAIQLKTWYLAQLASGMTAATIAAGVLRTALLTIAPFAVVAGLTLIGSAMQAVADDARLASDEVTTLYETVKAEQIADPWKQAANPTKVYIGLIRDAKVEAEGVSTALNNIPKKINTRISITTSTAYDSAEAKRLTEQAFGRGALDMSLGKWETVDPDPKGTGAKAAGKKAAGNFVGSFQMALREQKAAFSNEWMKIATDFLDANPLKAEWTEFGSQLGNNIISGIRKDIEKNRLGLKFLKPIYDQAAKLQDAFAARTQFQVKLKQDILSMFDFKAVKTGLSGIIKQFKDQVAQTKKFKENLAELQKLGLSGGVFQKIVEGQDFNTAAELVKGGASAVGEVNTLFGQLTGFADEIATISGNSLYNLGVDAATGFTRTLEDGFGTLEGLYKKSRKQMQLQQKVDAAAELLRSPNQRQIAGISLEQAQKQFDEITARYNAAYGRGGTQVRPMQNLGLRAGLDQYFLGGGQMNGNISNQLAYLNMGSRDQASAIAAAREARREQRRQGSSISINVNGGLSTSAQIGQSIVEAIRAYERASGQVYASA